MQICKTKVSKFLFSKQSVRFKEVTHQLLAGSANEIQYFVVNTISACSP